MPDAGAVVGDGGTFERLVHQPRVGVGSAVNDRHALEGHPLEVVLHQSPYGHQHLRIGAGRVDDEGGVGSVAIGKGGGGTGDDPFAQLPRRFVGVGVARGA